MKNKFEKISIYLICIDVYKIKLLTRCVGKVGTKRLVYKITCTRPCITTSSSSPSSSRQ